MLMLQIIYPIILSWGNGNFEIIYANMKKVFGRVIVRRHLYIHCISNFGHTGNYLAFNL